VEKENIFILIHPNIKEIGRMICSMDLEFKNGQMVLDFKEIFKME